MQQIISNLQDGTITMSDSFNINALPDEIDATPYFNSPGSEYAISFTNLQNVSEITNFKYDTLGLNETRYLLNYYRISRDGLYWTDWLDLKRTIDNFPTVSSGDPLYMDVKWVRTGTSTTDSIRLLGYTITGKLDRQLIETAGDGITTVYLGPGENAIWKAPFIYKVFSVTDIEVLPEGATYSFDIKYRYSQDNSRTWSNWEDFTKENITTLRINPIRFFQIEYSITNNSLSHAGILDINLIGNFQNVSKDYFKTNLYGIRECCLSNRTGYYDTNGNYIAPDNTGGITNASGVCDTTGAGSSLPELSSQDKANLFQPYEQTTAMSLLNKLSSDAEQIFGHIVIYFATDPDKKGQDHTFHEYQLHNIVCESKIKVSVDGNNFPDSQIVMNQFDLSLFESMTIHITKQIFKEAFGPQRRPSKEDILYFCDINRLFIVDHAQQFRGFNNAATYYKIILKKYSEKASIQSATQEIKDKIDQLTQNSTIDQLFGIENDQDKASIANKQQFTPLTRDPIRLEYLVDINRELIENSSTIISKSHYDMSSVTYGQTGVSYKNLDPILKVSDNIGFMVWFKLNNYITNEIYNFIKYYDDSNLLGWRVDLVDDSIRVTLNNDTYTYNLLGVPSDQNIALQEDVWYCYILNIDQRQRNLQHFIYKRNVEEEDDAANLTSNILRKVYQSNQQTIVPINYQIENATACQILGSDMLLTNIRIFIETIPENQHNKICNQYVIRDDSKYLVFADNATSRLYLPRLPLFE